jgi:hypothetical protein
VQDNILAMANLLVHQKGLDIRSLITGQLNDVANFLIILNGTVATEILLERLANSLRVQVIRQTGYCRHTFTTITLLDTNVDLFLRRVSGPVSSVLKGVF